MIGAEIRSRVFRDTASFYESFPADQVASSLLNFVRRRAGRSILDLGCASGNYCLALAKLGYSIKGADINPRYVEMARQRGVDAAVIRERVPFDDQSFDTVILFEVLEHLEDPGAVLREARRLARNNILVTTPHSGGIEDLQRGGLLFEHFAELDHKNFFTEESLRDLLSGYFRRVTVMKGDPINPLVLFRSRYVRFAGRLLLSMRVVKPHYHFRLFAEALTR